jgi:maleate isomerase
VYNDHWAWRARLGVLVTHKDAVPECEFWEMAPPGVTVHAARFASPRGIGADFGANLGRDVAESEDISRGLHYLGQMHLGAIAVCFGTGSFVAGREFDESFTAKATERAGGTPVSLAGPAMLAAARVMGITRPLVVTPSWFSDSLMQSAERYHRDAGLDVAGLLRFDLGAGWRDVPVAELYDRDGHLEVRPENIYAQVKRAFPRGADGVMIVGNGMRAIGAIETLEADLDCPVLAGNQASLWHCLQLSRVNAEIEGYGELFERRLAVDEETAGTRAS